MGGLHHSSPSISALGYRGRALRSPQLCLPPPGFPPHVNVLAKGSREALQNFIST